jgi:hypothetical protein
MSSGTELSSLGESKSRSIYCEADLDLQRKSTRSHGRALLAAAPLPVLVVSAWAVLVGKYLNEDIVRFPLSISAGEERDGSELILKGKKQIDLTVPLNREQTTEDFLVAVGRRLELNGNHRSCILLDVLRREGSSIGY